MNNRERREEKRRAYKRAEFLNAVNQSVQDKGDRLSAFGGSATPDRDYKGLSKAIQVYDPGTMQITWILATPEQACYGPKQCDHYNEGLKRERDAAADRLANDCARMRKGLPIVGERREGSYSVKGATMIVKAP